MKTKQVIPYGAAALGAYAGYWLYSKKPMGGMVGKLVAIAGGVAGGYYLSTYIIKQTEKKEIAAVSTMVSEPSVPSQD